MREMLQAGIAIGVRIEILAEEARKKKTRRKSASLGEGPAHR